jgi:hypothetical protein
MPIPILPMPIPIPIPIFPPPPPYPLPLLLPLPFPPLTSTRTPLTFAGSIVTSIRTIDAPAPGRPVVSPGNAPDDDDAYPPPNASPPPEEDEDIPYPAPAPPDPRPEPEPAPGKEAEFAPALRPGMDIIASSSCILIAPPTPRENPPDALMPVPALAVAGG